MENMHNSRHIPKTLLALLPALALTLSCASTGGAKPASSGGSAPSAPQRSGPIDPSGGVFRNPAVRETTPDRTRREPPPEEVRAVREEMEDAYQNGLEAYRAGRYDEAKEHFDRAVDVVLGSSLELADHPALQKVFDDIVRDIADLDAELYSRQGSGGDDSRSPLDELKDITTHMHTDEAEREREKVKKVVGEITYDIPIELNTKVLAFVEAFQTRLRGEFEAGLKRSGAYLPMIREIFRREGLPEDLAYMAHQESAFKNNAYSRARARGMWQFMSFTGRRYGLKRDLWVDERSDFEKATRSAAGYLKDLYARYGDWYLAMAAYNAGEGKIDRAIRRSGTRDYWKIARTNHIRRETKYYVPAILASILIDKSPQDYGFDVETDPELHWETVDLDQPTDLEVIARGVGADLQTIRDLNPELRGLVTPLNVSSYTVRVPEGTARDLSQALAALPVEERVSWTVHETRPGETFTSIARANRIQVRALLDANPRYAGRRLRSGTALNVPLGGRSPSEALQIASREDRPTYEAGERVAHRVRRGENLQRIAGKYRTTVGNLKRWNNLNGSLIRPGQRLVAYYGEKGDAPYVSAAAANAPVSIAEGRIEYVVQRGDSLWSIARKFGASVEDLCGWNGISQRSVLKAGERLVIGGQKSNEDRTNPIRHRVRQGESLYRIATKYDVTVSQVRSWNDLGGRATIYPGQVLTILVN